MSKKKKQPAKGQKPGQKAQVKEQVTEQAKTKATQAKAKETKKADLPFTKKNYILLIIGVVLIAIGFILMTGGGAENPEVFNPDIFSFRRITLAPIMILAGFVVEIFAIMIKPKED